MHKLKATLSLILVALVIIFAVQNSSLVEIQFLFWSFETPRVFLILALLIIGALLGVLSSSLTTLKRKLH